MHLVNCKTQLYFFFFFWESIILLQCSRGIITDRHSYVHIGSKRKSYVHVHSIVLHAESLNSSSIGAPFHVKAKLSIYSCLYKTSIFLLSFYHISSLFFQLSCLSLCAFFHPTRRNGRCNPVWRCAEDHWKLGLPHSPAGWINLGFQRWPRKNVKTLFPPFKLFLRMQRTSRSRAVKSGTGLRSSEKQFLMQMTCWASSPLMFCGKMWWAVVKWQRRSAFSFLAQINLLFVLRWLAK